MGSNQQESVTRGRQQTIGQLCSIFQSLNAKVVDRGLIPLLLEYRLCGEIGPSRVGILFEGEGALLTLLLQHEAALPHVRGSAFWNAHGGGNMHANAVGAEVEDGEVAQAVGREDKGKQDGVQLNDPVGFRCNQTLESRSVCEGDNG